MIVSELQEQLISFNVVLPGPMLPLRTRFRLPSSHPILLMLYLLVRTSMLYTAQHQLNIIFRPLDLCTILRLEKGVVFFVMSEAYAEIVLNTLNTHKLKGGS